MNGFYVFLFLLVAYILAVYGLNRAGKLGGSLELMGPFLMMRTQRGKPTIERIAKAKRTWSVFGDVGIALTWIAGLLMVAVLVLVAYVFFRVPEQVSAEPTPVSQLIGLPGVNPLIPLWYGIFALIVALIVHEGCHGILSRHAGIKVKSLGLLWFVVPIGAFVEPDEVELERATPRERLRMFAAGPTSNIVLATITGVVFCTLIMTSLSPVNGGQGIMISGVTPHSGAEAAALQPGSIIVAVDEAAITNYTSFSEALKSHVVPPGTTKNVTLRLLVDGEVVDRRVELRNRYDVESASFAAGTQSTPPQEESKNSTFLGVTSVPMPVLAEVAGALTHPIDSGFDGLIIFTQYPIFAYKTGMDVLSPVGLQAFDLNGPLASLGPTGFSILANIFYWMFWLNLMLATFNAIPAGPLDGGQMLKTTLRSFVWKRYGIRREDVVIEKAPLTPGVTIVGRDEATQAKLDRSNALIRRTTASVGYALLFLILLPAIGPWIVNAFL